MIPVQAQPLADALAKGLGRAHLILEADPSSDPNVAALVDACLTDLTYDAQVEGSRAAYLHELIDLAGLAEPVASALAASLNDTDADDATIAQRWELAGLLARDGAPGVREAMSPALERLVDGWLTSPRDAVPPTEPARQLGLVGGVPGTLFALGQLGRLAAGDSGYWDDGQLLDEARSLAGSGLDETLAEARRGDPNLEGYLRAVEVHEAEAAAEPTAAADERRRRWDQPWADAQRAIERQVRGTGQSGFMWSQWGRRASERELDAAARALVELPREDLELLRPYLSVFRRRAFPHDPQPLIDLLDDQREHVAWFAANALEQMTHPAARAMALRMAEEGPLRERAGDLLAANWRPGDERLIERLLRDEQDTDRIHTIASGLSRILERHLSADLVSALILGYEKTPCSNCRGDFAEALLRVGALPDELRAECRWDARPETRELVAQPV